MPSVPTFPSSSRPVVPLHSSVMMGNQAGSSSPRLLFGIGIVLGILLIYISQFQALSNTHQTTIDAATLTRLVDEYNRQQKKENRNILRLTTAEIEEEQTKTKDDEEIIEATEVEEDDDEEEEEEEVEAPSSSPTPSRTPSPIPSSSPSSHPSSCPSIPPQSDIPPKVIDKTPRSLNKRPPRQPPKWLEDGICPDVNNPEDVKKYIYNPISSTNSVPVDGINIFMEEHSGDVLLGECNCPFLDPSIKPYPEWEFDCSVFDWRILTELAPWHGVNVTHALLDLAYRMNTANLPPTYHISVKDNAFYMKFKPK